jgi:HSP20 family protein
VKPEDVEITITGDVLCIKAEAKAETKEEKVGYFRQERRYGSCARSVSLPVPVQTDRAEAKFKDGVLTVTLPKAEEAKPKAIKVKPERS